MHKKLSALIGSLLVIGNNSCSNTVKGSENETPSLIKRLKMIVGNDASEETFAPELYNTMCYEPAEPITESKSCSVCGAETTVRPDAFTYELNDSIITLARYGYEGEVESICPDCLEKLIDKKGIDTDLKADDKIANSNQYGVLNIRKMGEKDFHQVVITNLQTFYNTIEYLRKQKKGETATLTAEEIAAYELLTGKKHDDSGEKEELQKRLKATAQETVPEIEIVIENAMCYEPAAPIRDENEIGDDADDVPLTK